MVELREGKDHYWEEEHREPGLFTYFSAILREKEEKYMSLFAGREEATKLALDAADRAVIKSEQGVDKRFAQIKIDLDKIEERLSNTMSKEAYDAAHSELTRRIEVLEGIALTKAGESKGSAATRAMYAAIGSGIISTLGLVALIIHLFMT